MMQTNVLTGTNIFPIPAISEYIVVMGTNASDLATNVQQKVVSGYQPFGDVFADEGLIAAPVLRPERRAHAIALTLAPQEPDDVLALA